MANFYENIKFYIVESDSNDDTREILQQLSLEMSNFSYQSFGRLESSFPDRIERLRFCRNKYVDKLRSSKGNFSEILVVDFDIKNNCLTQKSMEKVMNWTIDWDGLFANQNGPYFDILALRRRDWVSTDCMVEVQDLIRHGFENEQAKELAVWSKMRRIPRNQKPIEVESAFGGMALYKKWVFQSLDYSISSTPIQAHESEHVALNYKIRKSGGHLYIHPHFLNFSWNPHNLGSIRVFRKLDNMTKRESLGKFRKLIRSRLG
jgi:hypothetical protein